MGGQQRKKETVLFYWPDGEFNETHVYKDVGEIPRKLHEMGYDVVVLVGKLNVDNRQLWDRTYELGEVPQRGLRPVKLLRKIVRMNATLLRLLLKERPNVIIVMWSDPRVLPVLAIYKYFIMKNRNIKIINKLDSDGSFASSALWSLYYQLGTLFSDKVIIETTCAYEKVTSSSLLKLMSRRLTVVPDGVSDDILSYGPRGRERRKVVLFVGANEYRKGLDVLIRALFRIKDELDGWKVVITSKYINDQYQNLIKKYIKLYELEDKIEFINADRAELLDLYFSSSIFVLPTRQESYGIAVAEALASGLIVITTDSTCRRDFEHLGALVVKKDDVQELADALRYAIKKYEKLLAARDFASSEGLLNNTNNIKLRLNYHYLVSLIIK